MKTLYFLRHAKSGWKDADLSDIDRPLNARGKENAPAMGKHLRKLHVKPQLIISSPAKRAFSTANIIASEIGYEEKNIKIEMGLYGANIEELLSVIHALEGGLDKVMLVGHNPGFTQIIEFLTGTDIVNLPTCGVARVDHDIKKWHNVKPGKGKLVWLESPKKSEEKAKI